MSTFEAISLIVAVIALAVSGLTWWVTTRPRLVVRPRFCPTSEEEDGKLVTTWYSIIEVCNVGHVPVVGATVGFRAPLGVIDVIIMFVPERMKDSIAVWYTQREKPHPAVFFCQEPVSKGLEWQREVGPQQIAMIRFSPCVLRAERHLIQEQPRIGRAYATTMVGNTFKASRRDMRRFRRQLKEWPVNQPLQAIPCTSPPESRTPREGPRPAAGTAAAP